MFDLYKSQNGIAFKQMKSVAENNIKHINSIEKMRLDAFKKVIDFHKKGMTEALESYQKAVVTLQRAKEQTPNINSHDSRELFLIESLLKKGIASTIEVLKEEMVLTEKLIEDQKNILKNLE